MAHTTTWEPCRGAGDSNLPTTAFAFPRQRIDPLTDAMDVRSALEHFNAINEVSEDDRRVAFENIKKAAEHFHVEVYGETYEEMCHLPQVEILPKD